jgi:Domain of unknown function (DUF4383)
MENVTAGNMTERYCALTVGILFLILGLAGFIPDLVSVPGTDASYIPLGATESPYAKGFGFIFGLFPTNFFHNLVRCSVGLLGIASYFSLNSARLFNSSFAVAYTLIAIMGLLPFGKTMFGLMPLFGHNVWFNALTALATVYYGIIIPAKVKGVSVSHNL